MFVCANDEYNTITIISYKKKNTGNKIGEMAECELRQRKKEDDTSDKLQKDDEEIKFVEQDQDQTEDKPEPVRCILIRL